MFIDGLVLASYRSFGDTPQLIGPFGKINVFIGPNNSGKSNILLYLTNHFPSVMTSIREKTFALQLTESDMHVGSSADRIVIGVALADGGQRRKTILENLRIQKARSLMLKVEGIFDSAALKRETKASWFIYEGVRGKAFGVSMMTLRGFDQDTNIPEETWSSVFSALAQASLPGVIHSELIAKTIFHLAPLLCQDVKVALIPAIRKIGEPGDFKPDDFSGVGIIERLNQLANPGTKDVGYRERFETIVQFVQIVTQNQTASLRVPHQKDMILVRINNKELPLTSLGTGIHEVVILAIAATVLRNQVICIEEPEIHLHPLLQKQLLRYLQDKTDNQYFITTHSAHILDTPRASVFHVSLDKSNDSVVTPVFTDSHKSAICDELGYRASDLLQANCVIWVEGPTDRIYLKHWIYALDSAKDLVEGLHYSIMFYGGRLLSHLTANDPELDKFISLRRLNRHVAIVMDSDRATATDDINPTKKRLVEESQKDSSLSWVTAGRTIENYIRPEVMFGLIKSVYPNATGLAGENHYAKMPYFIEADDGKEREANKLTIAAAACQSTPDLTVLDLNERITELVNFIRKSNGM